MLTTFLVQLLRKNDIFFSVIGCADMIAPVGMTFEHVSVTSARLLCDETDQVFSLKCVENEWRGANRTCSPGKNPATLHPLSNISLINMFYIVREPTYIPDDVSQTVTSHDHSRIFVFVLSAVCVVIGTALVIFIVVYVKK